MDPDLDHEHFFKLYWVSEQKENFQIIFQIFKKNFMLKFDESFRNKEI